MEECGGEVGLRCSKKSGAVLLQHGAVFQGLFWWWWRGRGRPPRAPTCHSGVLGRGLACTHVVVVLPTHLSGLHGVRVRFREEEGRARHLGLRPVTATTNGGGGAGAVSRTWKMRSMCSSPAEIRSTAKVKKKFCTAKN